MKRSTGRRLLHVTRVVSQFFSEQLWLASPDSLAGAPYHAQVDEQGAPPARVHPEAQRDVVPGVGEHHLRTGAEARDDDVGEGEDDGARLVLRIRHVLPRLRASGATHAPRPVVCGDPGIARSRGYFGGSASALLEGVEAARRLGSNCAVRVGVAPPRL